MRVDAVGWADLDVGEARGGERGVELVLAAEQQFRRIIGYRDLATLVIAVERHTLHAAPKDHVRQEITEPVTV